MSDDVVVSDTVEEAGASMTLERALSHYASESPWLRERLNGGHRCGCGSCHFCAYTFLLGLGDSLSTHKSSVKQLSQAIDPSRDGEKFAFRFGKAVGAADAREIERIVNKGLRHTSGAQPYNYLLHWLKVARFFAYATQDDSWGEFEKLFAIIVKRLVVGEARAKALEAMLDREGIAYPKDDD